MVKNLPAMQETWVQSLGQEDPLEKGMATHSTILAWRIPWTEEPGRPQSMGSQESDTTQGLNDDNEQDMFLVISDQTPRILQQKLQNESVRMLIYPFFSHAYPCSMACSRNHLHVIVGATIQLILCRAGPPVFCSLLCDFEGIIPTNEQGLHKQWVDRKTQKKLIQCSLGCFSLCLALWGSVLWWNHRRFWA